MGLAQKLLTAILWATLEKAGKAFAVRDDLKEGAKHDVQLHVYGTIDGCKVDQPISGTFSVAVGKKAAANKNLAADQSLAWVLQSVDAEMAAKIEERLLADAKKLEARAKRKNKDLKEGEPTRTLHLEVDDATDQKSKDAAKRILQRYMLTGTKSTAGATSYKPAAA
ncbi:hypothetical protein [Blastopirellula retiformator]|uniref:Uncharacterized protein n=1 Tax=Blastopirellula retiformator TaxID=2527970 RepID=A0A5C5VL03_9BACT|nr:hypothetical protein [Blastopirellula retiformator]TWT38703.1 hypothetical protein Enr8_03970 [Blastopirellula retiformator]